MLAQQVPELELGVVEWLGAGWEYDVYLVDGHVVVRFPRYADVSADLDKAEALLEFLGRELRGAVMVPRIVLKGAPSPSFPHAFFGHELIPGVTAKDAATLSEALAADLGRALTRIHGVSVEGARRLGVGSQKWDCRSSFAALTEVLSKVPRVAELVPEGGAWVRGVGVPGEYRGPIRFIHDDLQPEHIIVDDRTGRLRGIIDWGAGLGDPAQDFSFLAAWGGAEFTAAVLAAYDGPVDPEFRQRVSFLGCVRALGWLAYEVETGRDTRWTAGVVRDLVSRSGRF